MQINQQPPEKRDMQDTIDVHSIFSTIQGEGPFCGHPAIFIRLAGCNLQCPGCDTEYTKSRTRYYPEDIVKLVHSKRLMDNTAAKLVVITGGEPFRQNIEPLVSELYENGFEIQIETNGTLKIPYGVYIHAMIVCSPKAAKVHPSIYQYANCFKYVMKAGNMLEEDGLPLQALDHKCTPFLARPPKDWDRPIYLQPMDEQDDVLNMFNRRAVLQSCKRHGYIIQLQIHKMLEVE